MKASAKILAALALAAGLTMAAPSVAQAATTEPKPVCGTWTASEFIGSAPGVTNASVVDKTATTATLKRTAADRGVEYLRKGLDITGPLTITVQVNASAEEAASGAVRIFGYSSANPNTLTDAPTYGAPKPEDVDAVATATNSALTLELEAGEHLGALGFTSDASNPNFGEVTFGPGTIGNRPISFNACPQPPASPSATPTKPAATKPPTVRPTGSVEPTDVPVLPQTPGASSTKLAVLGGIAGALLIGGVGLYLAARGRRTRYTA